MRHAFSLGCNDSAALSFWEQDILYPFSSYIIRQLLCLIERGSEASTGWVRGLLSGHSCEEVEGGA